MAPNAHLQGDAFLVAFPTPEDACAWCVAVQQVRKTVGTAKSCMHGASLPYAVIK